MKKITAPLLITSLTICLLACGNPPPDKLFAQVVLNANLLFGFAGAGMQRELATPSDKLTDANAGTTAPMKRAEVVQTKLATVEANYEKVKALSSNDETKDLLTAARALYEFVIPVYKNEYTQLAALYDEGAPADKVAALEKTIQEKYGAKFQELYNAVGTTGKAYAAKHNIQFREVNPAPPSAR